MRELVLTTLGWTFGLSVGSLLILGGYALIRLKRRLK
jgi:hypothetical protein